MATRQNGGRTVATANTVTAMKNSATKRQCPKCGRKSALAFYSDEFSCGSACRWCDYTNATLREWD